MDESKQISELIKELRVQMLSINPHEREEVMQQIQEGYCTACMINDPVCRCLDDV